MGDERKPADPIPKAPEPPQKEASPPAGEAPPQAADTTASPLLNAKPLDLSLTPPSLLGKEALGPTGGPFGNLPRLSLFRQGGVDPASPGDQIDWFAMRQPFLNHGLPLTGRDGDQITLNFRNSVTMMRNWGMPQDLAIKAANLGLAFAYDTQLGLESPNTLEKFDRDTERMLGPGKKLGKLVVPIVTPDTLSWAVEKVSGKKIDFRF